MKYIFLFIFLIIVLIITIITYLYFYFKYIIYRDCVYICKYLKNNISFNKNSIDDILNDVYEDVHYISKVYLKSKNKKNYKLFNENDIGLINGFFDSLGSGDVDYEINSISYYVDTFKEKESDAKDDVNKKGIAYAKLVFCFGIIVIILLL